MGVSAPAVRPVRFAALRGRVPLSWTTIAVFAAVFALGDGIVLTVVRGAVGAIERTQTPFDSWLVDSALTFPLYVLAMVWAFARMHRKHDLTGPALRRPGRVVTGALLLAAVSTVLGFAVMVGHFTLDYRLQSTLLEKDISLHNHAIGASETANPQYAAGSTWTPEQRDTIQADVTAAGWGAGLLAGANLLLVGWVVALRGGRLDVRPRTRSSD